MATENPLAHLPGPVADLVGKASSASGLPDDQLRLLFCLLAAVPFGLVHKLLPNATIKHVYSVLVGFSFSYLLVGYGVFHVVFAAAVTYLAAATLPREFAPKFVFCFSLGYLSIAHIYRMWIDFLGWRMDYSMLQMMITVKSITFAYNVADGKAIAAKVPLSTHAKTAELRASRAVLALPSPLEFASYVFFFGGVLVGPCFEIKEYLDFTDLTLFKKAGLEKIPSSIGPAIKCVVYALLAHVGMIAAGFFPVIGGMNTAEFLAKPFLYKFFYAFAAITLVRFKYYFAWYLAEAGCNASGFGFSGVRKEKNGDVTYLWTRCTNCRAWDVETASSLPGISNNWNMGVNNWLKHYVYMRLDAPDWLCKLLRMSKTQIANFATKICSAFWHGFYPGYYLFFLAGAFGTEFDNLFRRAFFPEPFEGLPEAEKQRKRAAAEAKRNSPLWRFVGWFTTMAYMNYFGVTFHILRADWGLTYWASTYFCGFLALGAAMPLLARMAARQRKKEKAAAAAAGGAPAEKTE